MAKTRTIKLTQGKEAIIDAADFDIVSKYKWFYWSGDHGSERAYNEKLGRITLGRFLLGLVDDRTIRVGHKNYDGLDCRRENLVTGDLHDTARRARKWRKNTTSKYKGVCWHKQSKRWAAAIRVNGKVKHLGNFVEEVAAAKAYNEAALAYFGEESWINKL